MQKPLYFVLLALTTTSFFIFSLFLFQKNSNWLLEIREAAFKSRAKIGIDYVEIPNVMISFTGRGDHYCKAGFTLAVEKSSSKYFKSPSQIDVLKASIIDLMSLYSYDNLLSLNGKIRLKQHIKASINKEMSSNIIDDVYFRELVLQ